MSSFGQWYEQQKATNPNGDIENGVAGDANASSSSSMLPLFGGAAPDWSGTSLEGVSANVSGSLTSLKSSFESQFPAKVCGMNYQERFRMFCALLLVSALFFLLAFFIGLPVITFRPHKFALSFTCGSLTFMGSFAILKGPSAHLRGMLEKDRLVFSIIYISSMLATLYATVHASGMKGYATVIVCSGFQLVALVWYLISFIPGGSAGLQVLAAAMMKMMRPFLVGCVKIWRGCVSAFLSYVSR